MQKNKSIKLVILFSTLLSIIIIIGCISLVISYKSRNVPNIILITIDALRPDYLSCYGYEEKTSANIDILAREGAMFTQSIAQTTWTVPSMGSLITSSYVHTHNMDSWGVPLNSGVPNLIQVLKDNGYYTALINCGEKTFTIKNLEKSFDISHNIILGNAQEVTNFCISWLRKWIIEKKKTPLFLWVYYGDVHGPFNELPNIYKRMYLENLDLQAHTFPIVSIEKEAEFRERGYIQEEIAEDGITSIDYYYAQYKASINFVDDQIGHLLNELRELDLLSNSVIVLTADHGQALGEHNDYLTHGISLYDELLKIPLIFYGKGIPAGRIIKNQVRLIDLAPTILDLINIKKDERLQGYSLYQLIINKENYFPKFAFSQLMNTHFSIRTDKWKLILVKMEKGAQYELYNLELDPKELNNVINKEKNIYLELKTELEKWMNEAVPSYYDESVFLEEEVKQRLRALGYAQ